MPLCRRPAAPSRGSAGRDSLHEPPGAGRPVPATRVRRSGGSTGHCAGAALAAIGPQQAPNDQAEPPLTCCRRRAPLNGTPRHPAGSSFPGGTACKRAWPRPLGGGCAAHRGATWRLQRPAIAWRAARRGASPKGAQPTGGRTRGSLLVTLLAEQNAVDRPSQLVFLRQPYESVHFFTILEEHQRRNGLNVELLR